MKRNSYIKLLVSAILSLMLSPQLRAVEFSLQVVSLQDIRARMRDGVAPAPAVLSVVPVEYRVEEGPGHEPPDHLPNLTRGQLSQFLDFLGGLQEDSPSLRKKPATNSQIKRLLKGLQSVDILFVDPIPIEKWDKILAALREVAAQDAQAGKGWDDIIDHSLAKCVSMLRDGHSRYMDKKESKQFVDSMARSFSGIGVVVLMDKEGLRVDAVYPGSGAEAAGLQEQDIIVEVAGQSLGSLGGPGIEAANALRSRLRGNEGSYAVIRVVRNGQKLLDPIRVRRKKLASPNVFAKMVSPRIGYLYLSEFRGGFHEEEAAKQRAERDLASDKVLFGKIHQLRREGAASLVIDLRGNLGGEIGAVSSIASEFLRNGQDIVSFKHQGLLDFKTVTKGNGKFSDIPIVVLIDGHSASASEILAGAMQEHRRGYTIIGSRSFGKGSQQLVSDMGDGRFLRITQNRWYTPNGRNISGKTDPETDWEIPGTGGIVPDVTVDVPAERAEQIMRQIQRGLIGRPVLHPQVDPVLEKAIEVLSGANAS